MHLVDLRMWRVKGELRSKEALHEALPGSTRPCKVGASPTLSEPAGNLVSLERGVLPLSRSYTSQFHPHATVPSFTYSACFEIVTETWIMRVVGWIGFRFYGTWDNRIGIEALAFSEYTCQQLLGVDNTCSGFCSSSEKQLVPSSQTKLCACASKENPQLVWENRRGPHSACGNNVKKQLVASVRTTLLYVAGSVRTTLQYVAQCEDHTAICGSHEIHSWFPLRQLPHRKSTAVLWLAGRQSWHNTHRSWEIMNNYQQEISLRTWQWVGVPNLGKSLNLCSRAVSGAYIFYGEVVSIPTQQFLSTKSPDPQPHKKRKFELKRNTNGISCFPHEISFEDSSPLTWPLFLLLFSILLQLRYLEYFPFCRQ